MNINELIAENKRRTAALQCDYDPHRGTGAWGERVKVPTPVHGLPWAMVPVTMTDDPEYGTVRNNADAWRRLRCRHDFEYWCANCVTVKDKETGADIALTLNRPQRRVAGLIESQRLSGKPIRLIMLKARQWGGSTLVQMYMAWIQSVHRRNWHSLICAHVKDTAAQIRGMYTKVLDNYPADLWDGDKPPSFTPFERSMNVRTIAGRGCNVIISSAESQDSIRGADIAMAHLSETAFWPTTPKRTPDDLVRAVCGSVAFRPYTLVAMESTANGVGNFFHKEWLRACQGRSDKTPVFVPWHEIDIYSLDVRDSEVEGLWNSLTDYERALWDDGRTLQQIKWFHNKALEYSSLERMLAEYPGTPVEAFANTGDSVFDPRMVEALRRDVRPPQVTGELSAAGDRVVTDSRGRLQVWELPQADADYVAAVDVGGRSDKADWSVIAVMRRGDGDTPPRVVAQWRGHIDHDLLARKAMDLAMFYNEALLVVESNTLESADAAADGTLSVLSLLANGYDNLYTRRSVDRLTQCVTDRVGFHTNRQTKPMLIMDLIAAVRQHGYVERDGGAVDELATYTQLPNGAYAARQGCHDDMLMTRALALHVMRTTQAQTHMSAAELMPPRVRW